MQNKLNNKIRPIDGIIRPTLRTKSSGLKNQNVFSGIIKNSGLKMAGVAVIAIILLASLSSVGSTVSYFNDTESSIGNRLQAGILSLLLDGGYNHEETETVEENIGTAYFDVNVGENDSGLPMIYKITGELSSSNPAGCELMTLNAHFGSFAYEGSVPGLSTPQMTEFGEWDFVATLPLDNPNLPAGAECRGEIVFKAGLAGVSEDIAHTFSDEKRYPFEVYNWNSSEAKSIAPSSLIAEESTDELEGESDLPAQAGVLGEATSTPIVEEGVGNIGNSEQQPASSPAPAPSPVPSLGGGVAPTPAPEEEVQPEPVEEPTPETEAVEPAPEPEPEAVEETPAVTEEPVVETPPAPQPVPEPPPVTPAPTPEPPPPAPTE